MKPYLRAIFLLFLILLDQSLSASAGINLGRFQLFKQTKVLGGDKNKFVKRLEEWEDFLGEILDAYQRKSPPPPHQLKSPPPPHQRKSPPPPHQLKSPPPPPQRKSPPPPPNAPPKQINIKGLSVVKDYLSDYGYIQSSGPFNNSVDQETFSAIKTYQQFSNLQVTGAPNKQLFQQMSSLRCRVPDVNFDYNFTDDNMSYPKAGHRWFPNRNLTYGFLPENPIPDNMTKVFRDSFARWAQVSGDLNFKETTYDNADIQVGFYNFTNLGIEMEVYGGSLILLQADSSKKGMVFLDGTMDWLLPSENASLSKENGVLDLESAAMHQIGHLLGLDHSHKEDSVMYPYILASQQRKVQLSNSDKDNIRHQSAKVVSASHGRRLDVLLITTFSLGFAYVLLLLH